jgi:hypothetical protein
LGLAEIVKLILLRSIFSDTIPLIYYLIPVHVC